MRGVKESTNEMQTALCRI